MDKKQPDIHPGSAEWEAVCKKCGRCCYEKLDYRGKIYYTDRPCTHLDPVTRLCGVYQQRDQQHSDCARLTPEVVAAGILPADCPYVAGLEDYPAPDMDTE